MGTFDENQSIGVCLFLDSVLFCSVDVLLRFIPGPSVLITVALQEALRPVQVLSLCCSFKDCFGSARPVACPGALLR